MGKVVVKNKGRSSPLDLQMSLRYQQQQRNHQQQQQKQIRDAKTPQIPSEKRKSNPNSKLSAFNPGYSGRRSTRRNPNQESSSVQREDDSIEEEDEFVEKRKEKKMKLVLRLPSDRSPLDSESLDSACCASDSYPDDEIEERNHKKRKIDTIGSGSAHRNDEKVEAPPHVAKARSFQQGTPFESVRHESLPDRKWLLFLLERLQKKDTYGVFSEPVDPKELPDYHDVIEHPMDFGTVRKKLDSRVYVSLEQFEIDILLICSNALQYNATDTIYFRQARSIQELAKKSFECYRQDGENMITVPKVARRGRPPKYLKNPHGIPPLDRVVVASESHAAAVNITGRESSTTFPGYDLRRTSNKTVSPEFSTQIFRNHHIGDNHPRSLDEQKTEKRDDPVGYAAKGNSVKNGKKQFVLDENRRHTYRPSGYEAAGSSVFNTFNEEVKQLMAVGLHAELGYARSLARFSAGTGPLVWEMCSRRIERCLPAGTQFGRGWIEENDTSSSYTEPTTATDRPSSDKPGREDDTELLQPKTASTSQGPVEDPKLWTGRSTSRTGGTGTPNVFVCDSAQPDLALQL